MARDKRNNDLIGELTCQVAAGNEEEAEDQFSITQQSHVVSLAAKTDAFYLDGLLCTVLLWPVPVAFIQLLASAPISCPLSHFIVNCRN